MFVQLEINDADHDVLTKEDEKDKCFSSGQQNNLSGPSMEDTDHIHKR